MSAEWISHTASPLVNKVEKLTTSAACSPTSPGEVVTSSWAPPTASASWLSMGLGGLPKDLQMGGPSILVWLLRSHGLCASNGRCFLVLFAVGEGRAECRACFLVLCMCVARASLAPYESQTNMTIEHNRHDVLARNVRLMLASPPSNRTSTPSGVSHTHNGAQDLTSLQN